MLQRGIDFFANEVSLHSGNGTLGSARACVQFETVVVLRDPVQRTRSHVTELMRVYTRCDVKHVQSGGRP